MAAAWAPCIYSRSRGGRCSQPTASARSAFEEEQKLRRNEIVSRILKEEAEEDRRRRPHPPAPAAARPTLRDRTWGYLATVCEGKPATAASCYLVVVSRGPGGAQCRGDPTRTLTEGPPAHCPPRAPHGASPVAPRPGRRPRWWPRVPRSPWFPLEDTGRRPYSSWAAGHMVCAWELTSPEGRLRCKGSRHRSQPHAPWEPVPGDATAVAAGGSGSPQPRCPLQGDRRPVTGQGPPRAPFTPRAKDSHRPWRQTAFPSFIHLVTHSFTVRDWLCVRGGDLFT